MQKEGFYFPGEKKDEAEHTCPGYGGFVPHIVADNQFGHTFGKFSKENKQKTAVANKQHISKLIPQSEINAFYEGGPIKKVEKQMIYEREERAGEEERLKSADVKAFYGVDKAYKTKPIDPATRTYAQLRGAE